MADTIEPKATDYGPPVGVLWEASFYVGSIKHNVSSSTKGGAEKLIARILAGDLPGNV